MVLLNYFAPAVVFLVNFVEINAHGRLMDPVNRGSAFRKGFVNPPNYDDTGNFCGGFTVQHAQNGGKCGPCGDNYAYPQPRPNENGGTYGNGIIVKSYKAGSPIVVDVEVTKNHRGHFSFALCPLGSKKQLETEECFDSHKLKLVTGGYKYPVDPAKLGHILIKLLLPEAFTCEHCVLRWQYVAGNNWGLCEDGTGKLGCGNQETFRTCSDIKIE